MRSLRTRLALAFGAVVVAAVAATSLLTGRVATVRLEQMLSAGSDSSARVAAARLSRHYARDGAWGDPHPLLDSLAAEFGRPVLLLMPDGSTLAGPRRLERELTVREQSGELAIEHHAPGPGGEATGLVLRGAFAVADPRGGPPIGRVVVFPGGGSPRMSPVLARRSMLRSLAVAGLAAGVVGLILALLVARRIADPVEQLTRAVRRLESGEAGARVEPRGHDELAGLAGAFNAMAERVERTERLRRDLVNDVAHELRTPLTHLRGRLEAIEDGLAAPEPAAVKELLGEVEQLSKLVADLQDLAAAESGGLRLARETLSLGDELEAAARPFRGRAVAKDVAIDVSAEPGLRVSADRVRLRQIVGNLVDNAITHAPAHSTVTVTARHAGSEVHIEVRDQGVGIPAEHLPHVFERFYRADPSRSRETGGVGLGLAIVKNLVDAHGGTVHVESAQREGARFVVTLPAG